MIPRNMPSITKGCIYYTDNQIDEPIKSAVLKSIYDSGLPIVFSYLQRGEQRSYPQMVKQIISCLEQSMAHYVFFCEHDVLYSKSHFEFTPPRSDIFYYNDNVWRWDYPHNRFITYDRLICLSGMCVNRVFALDHYRRRLVKIQELGYDTNRAGEPEWARKMGYEPGTKKMKRGGFSDDDFETWHSKDPIIDVRHKGTFSPPKVTLESFKHLPTGWKEVHERP